MDMATEARRRTLLGLGVSPEVADYLINQPGLQSPSMSTDMSPSRAMLLGGHSAPPQIPPPNGSQGFELNGQPFPGPQKSPVAELPTYAEDPNQPLPTPAHAPSHGLGIPISNPLVAQHIQEKMNPTGIANPPVAPVNPYDTASERRAKLLERIAGLGEGFQQLANARTSGEIMLGVPEREAGVNTMLRGEAAEERDKISPAERDFYRSLNINIPEGVKRSELKTALPILSHMALNPTQQQRIDDTNKRFGEQKHFQIVDRFNNYGPLKDLEQRALKAKQLEQQLDDPSPENQRNAMLGLYREVAHDTRLSDQDRRMVLNYVGGPQALEATLQKAMTGTIPSGLIEGARRAAKLLESSVPGYKQQIADEFSKQYAPIFGESPESLSRMLAPPMDKPETKANSSSQTAIGPDGGEYPITDPSVIEAIRKGEGEYKGWRVK